MNKRVQRSAITFILSIVAMIAMVLLGGKTTAQEAGGSELSLDNVTVTSFKIIDVANGNKEIEYKKQSDAQYQEYKSDPSRFSNSLTENQKNSSVKLQLSISYQAKEAIKEGDTLVIPAMLDADKADFNDKPLFDGGNNEIGTWKYHNGNFVIYFSGDYIKNNKVTQFTGTFETGEKKIYLGARPKTTKLGERMVDYGTLGKEKIVLARERFYVVSDNLNTTSTTLYKSAPYGTDSTVTWQFNIESDSYTKNVNGTYYNFQAPYLLEHNGEYSPKALTDIYLEDTIENVTEKPEDLNFYPFVSGVDDEGKVIAGVYTVRLPNSALKRIEQGNRSREEVKNSLKKGEYSIYDNHDGSYTLMLKWWDMNDSTGLKYDDIPAINQAGGIGSYLQRTEPDIFGALKPETIEKINNIYKGKAIQNVFFYYRTKLRTVKERTEIKNTAKIETKQTGAVERYAKGVLTPSAGVADAPTDPLSIKLLKTDVKTGNALSEGFKFELQTSDDNGTTWKAVDVTANMVVSGTLHGDNTLPPDESGTVEVNSLVGGKKYRFFEKAHADGYKDVTEDNANPNTDKTPTAANSRVVEVNAQGSGKVVVMYNEQKPETVSTVSVEGTKTWDDADNQDGKRPAQITVNLLKNGQKVDSRTVTEADEWKWVFDNLAKYENGKEITYTVEEEPVEGYTATVKGYNITNTYTPDKTTVEGSKTWDDADNQDGKRPETITINLLKNGEKVATKTVTEADGWKWSFDNLAKYENGKEITYSIVEEQVESYSSKVDGYNVTNSYTPGKTSVQVTKKWDDADDKDGKRPTSVTITLYADSEKTDKTLVLDKENNWTGNFTELDEYKAGEKIEYSIKEETVGNGYVSEISGNVTEGFVVTNTRTPDPEVPVTPDPEVPVTPATQTPSESTTTTEERGKELPNTGTAGSLAVFGFLVMIAAALVLTVKTKKA